MHKSIYILLFVFMHLLYIPITNAQGLYTLSGKIIDESSEKPIAGASVFLKQLPSKGTVTDLNGSFAFKAPAGSYILIIKSIGYNDLEYDVRINKNRKLTLKLTDASYNVSEVEIIGKRKIALTETSAMGQLDIPIESLKSLPVLFGETDIIKTVQLLPGVQAGGEGNTGFYVRGGGADQNQVLLDKATVYNPGHLFNFFSVFNSDAIESTTLIKGNMPARYGGRLSSVLDIGMKDGNTTDFEANGGIGLIASRLTLQGPISKEKSSFIFSGRRTYVDVLTNPFLENTEQGGVPYHFYDVNGKLAFNLTTKDKLYLSGYLGRDNGRLKLSDGRFLSNFSWGNNTGTLRWNHLLTDKHFMNASAVFSKYDFEFNWEFGGFTTVVKTGVKDYNFHLDFEYTPNVRHHIEYGLQYTKHNLRPRTGQAEGLEDANFSTDRVKPKFANEAALYISDDWNITDKLQLSLGLRGSYFEHVGPFKLFEFDTDEQIQDSTVYGKGLKVKSFQALEPRVSLRYELNKSSSFKAAFTRSAQYLHLVSNAYTTLPLDIWVPSSAIIEPQKATQYAVGYFKSFDANKFEGSVELYYKDLQNQLEYREGFAPGPTNRDLEYEFASGSGESYGAEFFLRKNYGDLQGWLGYTLSRTTRIFPDLNQGKQFPARFDRRHDVSLVSTYKLNDKWTFGGTFVYGTGQATTLPNRRYFIEGNVVYQYGDRNSFRMEPTHRLDLAATLNSSKQWKGIESSWTFSIYNVYGRKNPFLYYIDNQGTAYSQNTALQAKKVSIIPFPLPSVTWNFTWK